MSYNSLVSKDNVLELIRAILTARFIFKRLARLAMNNNVMVSKTRLDHIIKQDCVIKTKPLNMKVCNTTR